MKKTAVLIILLSLVCISQSFGSDPVVIAIDEGNPPFMYIDGGKAAGFYPTLIESIFQIMKIPVVIKPLPWKRAILNADQGKMGIAGIYKNADRLKKYDYSNEIFQEQLLLFIHKEKAFPYNNFSDLKGKTIGVIRGWSYGDEFDTYIKDKLFFVNEERNDAMNFKLLFNKRFDCLIAIKESGQDLIAKGNFEGENYKGKIIQLQPPIAINSTYLIFSKTANQIYLLSKFNIVLKKMKAEGKYKKLIQTFFSNQ
ncbi:MAG: amino acid ABC transporter substrate-binding protein [Desulfobacterales bacterium]|nr:amino acid ABC transporter substrate-binding protein [Desulfobacterales bacterium]MCP4163413.1 amino acid ABC transporter substrate-binding protein [Deltaproteobacteria bacterium]